MGALAASAAQDLVYGVRPEHVVLSSEGVPGTVLMIEPTGPETYALIDPALGHLMARMPGRLAGKFGDPVRLSWQGHDVHLFDRATGRRLAGP